ncbi:MAG: hypothetical protein IKC89_07330 [Lentisphaeria bacterium]|nr:hypothetical protein [Lentisphaeria bacterium]
MKIADELSVFADGNRFTAFSSGEYAVEVSGEKRCFFRLGRVAAAGFSGALALPEKLRCHRTNDNLCAEFDSANVIPFGCEYLVKRHWTVFSNIALLNCDIAADNGGVVRDLELEPVEFLLDAAKVEFRIYGEDSVRTVDVPSGVIYSGSAAVLMVRVSSADGAQAEYICGDDLWRHRGAEKISGVSAEYRIAVDEGKVVLTRKVLTVPEEVVMEKRPWKFKSIFSWRAAGSVFAPETPGDELVIPDCFASASAHREIRKVVRRTGSDAVLTLKGEFPRLCDDPAHLERPAKNPVEHSDLGAAAADYLWANRELARRGSVLRMKGSSALYGEAVILSNLNSYPVLFEE